MSEELKPVWNFVTDNLKKLSLHPGAIKSFIANAKLTKLEDGIAHITVISDFAKRFMLQYAADSILKDLSSMSGEDITGLEITVKEGGPEKLKRVNTPDPIVASVKQAEPMFTDQGSGRGMQPSATLTSNLNPKYTFASFIVGNRNRLAHAAAMAVADKPGTLYNPLYLYGGVGLGKTHLMQAVGNAVLQRDPSKKVLYISCETFTNEFVEGIKLGRREDFKRKYRNVDIFLVDDIQFMGGKDGTQEEFFHTFNALYQTDKQIIITSDKVPSEIKDLEDRLASRFSMGMIADMQLPDLETREAILRSKCQERGINLSNDVVKYIAEHVETNIRELEGALTTVLVHLQSQKPESLTLEGVAGMLHAFISTQIPTKKNAGQQLMTIICDLYSVSPEDLKGPRRQQELVRPRQILMYLLKTELAMTFPAIGREMGGRDHTTAIHSVNKIEKEMKHSAEVFDELQRIKEMYYGNK